MAIEYIQVMGARVHNLKNINVEIPLHALTVVTGVSGSGKSSLAFDTLYAEGQRRYVESLSAYARQFLERMEKPDVDAIEGIAPAVAIRQKASTRNPRSTVGTTTEIYDYLRLLFARVGETVCPDCELSVARSDVDTAVEAVLAEAAWERCLALFPVQGAGTARDANPAAALHARLGELRSRGFNRLYQQGKVAEFSAPESLLAFDLAQPLFVVVDRLVIEAEARSRIVDAMEIAYRESGEAIFALLDAAGVDTPLLTRVAPGGRSESWLRLPAADDRTAGGISKLPRVARSLRYNQRFECKRCGRAFETPEPRLFSFNNPYGACARCQGFGSASEIDPAKVVPDGGRSLAGGAIEPWNTPRRVRWRNALKRFATSAGIAMDRPWRELADADRKRILDGEGRFPGVQGFFEHLESKKYKVHVRVLLSRYRSYARCPDCEGKRLRPAALAVVLRGAGARHNLPAVVELTVAQAHAFFQSLELAPQARAIAAHLLLEVRRRLEFLLTVGLDYLTLDRAAATLSGGEAQRIQLASCLGSQLVGSLYVLDEPSIGLHPRDTARLIGILHALRDLGNTIVVVEHDPEVMRSSDRLLDLGPGAGEQGGRLVASGTWQEVRNHPESLTGKYLRGELGIPVPTRRRAPGRHALRIEGAHAHNLREVDVEIPLQMLVAVTGVSGSGKSTLVHEVLFRNLQAALRSEAGPPPASGCRALGGFDSLSSAVMVDQSPIGRTPRSNPVTYMKAFDGIREAFARQPAARQRGYRAGHFSFNVPGGRCETCQGDGVVTVDMQFLADVELVCEECDGTRFQAGILEVELDGLNIHEVLQLTVHEALGRFAANARVARPLRLLEEIGLGYLRLGQSAVTLSGGEAQRVKLAAHLAQPRSAAHTLFLFDEPTTGLHVDDIAKLLAAFERLLAAGGSVVVIEHNLEVIKAADWVIDLGPEGGAGGGEIVAAGPPEVLATVAGSHTGRYLAPLLGTARPVEE